MLAYFIILVISGWIPSNKSTYRIFLLWPTFYAGRLGLIIQLNTYVCETNYLFLPFSAQLVKKCVLLYQSLCQRQFKQPLFLDHLLLCTFSALSSSTNIKHDWSYQALIENQGPLVCRFTLGLFKK